MKKQLRIATRKSPLAMSQANWVKTALEQHYPGLQVVLLELSTKGDEILDRSLAEIGGKGLFIKRLEESLLAGEADIAVHSMKDVPMNFPAGLCLPVICARESAEDVLVSREGLSFELLPKGAVVGSSSFRRQSMLLRARPDLMIKGLRGNVNTRLKKLEAGEYDAIVLARAGLERLGLSDKISDIFKTTMCLPAAGQGALGIECREDDKDVKSMISFLNHEASSLCVRAERAMVHHLNGSCHTPIGGYACIEAGECVLSGFVGTREGDKCLFENARGPFESVDTLGVSVAEKLLAKGAGDILKEYQ
jgi:hydroxymethylbilane synthase